VEIVFPKEGVPLVVSPSAITSFAPHPNAARLFSDFIFTRETQQVLADTEGLYTGHPEVKYPADRPKLGELKLLQVDPEELEKRNEEIKTRFVEFFGA
jgi:iron(III) transport system substrate-binding protein